MWGAVPPDWGHAIPGQMCQFCRVTSGFAAQPSLRGGSACPRMEGGGRQMGWDTSQELPRTQPAGKKQQNSLQPIAWL